MPNRLKSSEDDDLNLNCQVELMLNYIVFTHYVNYRRIDNEVFLVQYKIRQSRILILLFLLFEGVPSWGGVLQKIYDGLCGPNFEPLFI